MYDTLTTENQLDKAQAELAKKLRLPKFKLKRRTFDECRHGVEHLNSLLDEKGELNRPLSQDELRWIHSERALCRWDYNYWLKNYHRILSWEGNQVVYCNPTIAQSIIIDIKAEAERDGRAIMFMNLKARQLGVTTEGIATIGHRVQFHHNVMAVAGSSTPDKSEKMFNKMMLSWDLQPFWLMPKRTTQRGGEGALIRFGDQGSQLSIQHGSKIKADVGRGETPTAVLLSEVDEWLNPYHDIDASLIRAMHEHPTTFLQLESTAKKMHGYWKELWEYSTQYWGSQYQPAKVRPVFLPWYIGSDIYPTDTWLRSRPIPEGWKPADLTTKHAKKAQEYVKNTPLLQKYLGSDWFMPIEQQWYWEIEYLEHKAKGKLNIFFSELCVTGDARVSTEDGLIRLADAKCSEFTERGRVTNWTRSGNQKIVKITTKNGRELKCTPEHRIALDKVEEKWVEAQYLVPGDRLVLSPPKFHIKSGHEWVNWDWLPCCQVSVVVTREMARFLGYFMGDGSFYSGRVSIACSAKDEDTVKDVADLLCVLSGREPRKTTKGGMVLVESSSVRWLEILQEMGCLQPAIHKNLDRQCGWKKKVCVPESIFRSRQEVVAQFLRGLFEADGHSSKEACQVGFFTKYPEFAREVQLLLLGYGINACFKESEKVNGNGRTYTGRKLTLNGESAEIFFREIGFVSARKNSGKRIAGKVKSKGRTPDKIDLTDEVVSVEPAGEEEVYDLTIEGVHCFGANGILVHNCSNDIEAFQPEAYSIFDAEVIHLYSSHTSEPKAIYALDGPNDEIRPELKPDTRKIDPNKKRLTIDNRYQLVPMKMDGWPDKDAIGRIYLWELPAENEEYGFGVDTSQGVGLDFTVIEGVRKANMKRISGQVAEFRSNIVSASDAVPYLHCLARMFTVKHLSGLRKQPKLVIETNFGAGDNLQTGMRKLGWHNLHEWTRPDKKDIDPSRATHLGFLTVRWSRDMILSWFIKAIRDFQLDIQSPYLVNEMRTLCKDENRQAIASEYGSHDDIIMAFSMVYFSLHYMETGEFRSPFGRSRIALDQAPLNPETNPIEWSAPAAQRAVSAPDYEKGLVKEITWTEEKYYSERPKSPLEVADDYNSPQYAAYLEYLNSR